MKSYLSLLLTFALTTFLTMMSPIGAMAGGTVVDGGGGNGSRSTKEMVIAEMEKLPSHLVGIASRLEFYLNDLSKRKFQQHFGSQEIKTLTEQILKGNVSRKTGLVESIKTGSIQFELNHSRCNNSSNHDGRAYDNTACFVMTRLMTYNSIALRREFIALALHEIAHLYGMNEIQAQKIQKFALETPQLFFTNDNEGSRRIVNSVSKVQALASIAYTDLKDIQICNMLGHAEGQILDISAHAGEIGKYEIEIPHKMKVALINLAAEVQKLQPYCGVPERRDDSVTVGDRKTLNSRVDHIYQQATALLKDLNSYFSDSY